LAGPGEQKHPGHPHVSRKEGTPYGPKGGASFLCFITLITLSSPLLPSHLFGSP